VRNTTDGWYAWSVECTDGGDFHITRGQCPSVLDKVCAVTFPLLWADLRSSFKPY
jgi:hypothetical protein